MHLVSKIVTLLLLAMTRVNGGVLPHQDLELLLQTQKENHRGPVHEDLPSPRYALVIPLDEETAQQLSKDNYQIQVQLTKSDEEQRSVSVSRVRRQLTGGVTRDSAGGTTVNAQGTGTVWRSQDGQGRVNANGHWERTYNTPGVGTGPSIYGGGVSYDHATRGGGGVDVTRTPIGTQFSAQGRGTVWQSRDRNSRVDAHGDYSRNFGGPYGTGRPNYGVGATFTHKFG